MRILVVEDEDGISQFVRQGLQEAGHSVDLAHDGREGLDYALGADYDALIVDVMLPRLNGLDLLRDVRRHGRQTPVIMLTARDAVEDRVRGLDAGADDYIIKPFAFTELLARLRAVLRRPPLQDDAILCAGDLEVDTVHRNVRRGGKRIDLSPREFALLEYLVRHRNQALTRTQIIERVWDLGYYGDSKVVDVYIGYLRRKIDQGFCPALIETIRGVGYRLSTGCAEAA